MNQQYTSSCTDTTIIVIRAKLLNSLEVIDRNSFILFEKQLAKVNPHVFSQLDQNENRNLLNSSIDLYSRIKAFRKFSILKYGYIFVFKLSAILKTLVHSRH